MIISDEQAQLAARYAGPQTGLTCGGHPEVPVELMRRIILTLEATPEMRPERVVEARERLQTGAPPSLEIAEKIIARAISDALR
jgi:hypothetical protein